MGGKNADEFDDVMLTSRKQELPGVARVNVFCDIMIVSRFCDNRCIVSQVV